LLLIAIALMFSQFANLGFTNVNTRIFPFFRNSKKKHNGIMMLGVFVTLIGIVISLLVFYIIQFYFISEDYDSSGMLAKNIYYIPILIFFTTFFTFFDSYTKSLFDSVIGTFLRDFLVKFLNLLLIVSYIYGFVDFENFILYYVVIYISPLVLILLVLIKRKQLFFEFPNKELIKKYKSEIFKVALFGVISGFSGIAVMNIDKAMITDFVSLDAMSVYAVCFYFGFLISLPSKPLRKISSIILAEAWKKNNMVEIMLIYRKSISNLLLIGTLIYVGLIINLDNIFMIIPDYSIGRNVIIIIGVAYLIEMLSGTAAVIIGSSPYYRVQAYSMFLTIALVIATNLIFIPQYQITGAALASFITLFTANLFRFLFLRIKYKLQPYIFKHFMILLIGVFVIGINYFIPKSNNYIIDILVRSSIVSILFIVISYFTKVSEDANELLNNIVSKVIKGFVKNL